MKSSGVLLLLLCAAAPRAADERPNLLFCIADDWGWGHAGAYGDKVVKTAAFDRIAAEGALLTHAYCASPSCTPSRAAILMGQPIHRLDDTGNLWSRWPERLVPFTDLLEKSGYTVGLKGKGWGPGDFKLSGRTHNPAGPPAKSFDAFLKSVPDGRPFCFWFGSSDPHRAYDPGSGAKSGIPLDAIQVPAWLPDTPQVRSDIADYYFEVQRFDRDVGELLAQLEASGRAKNTLVVITSDNGMPFPRAKTNLHDSGSRLPLAVRWPAKIRPGQRLDAFVSFADYAPTFLEAAGLPAPAEMTGRSLLPLLLQGDATGRERVFIGRERHANVRRGDLSYPARALRTKDWLLILNGRPDAWPGGDPEKWKAVGPWGDCDGGPSKDEVLAKPDAVFYRLAFAKRPARELYEIAADPHQLNNIAAQRPEVAAKLEAELLEWLARTGDPRVKDGRFDGADERWDRYPYFGKP